MQIATLEDAYYDHRVHRGQLSSTLRASGTTLDEVRRFVPEGSDSVRLARIWNRYGAKLALRQMLTALRRRKLSEAVEAFGEMRKFLKSARN